MISEIVLLLAGLIDLAVSRKRNHKYREIANNQPMLNVHQAGHGPDGGIYEAGR